MKKLLLFFFLIFWIKGNSQNKITNSPNQITEIKNQGGVRIQYVLESKRIECNKAFERQQFVLSFIWSINDHKQYLQITIPEPNYRRVYTHDSVKLIFDDGSVVALNVVKDQNGYMLREKGEWLAYQFYLPFMVDMSDSLLNNLSSKTLKDVYFICLGNPQDISDDYKNIYYSVSKSDKRKFQKRASIDRIFTRRVVKRGKERIKLSAEKFTVFKSNL
jgi:hypothetical protein